MHTKLLHLSFTMRCTISLSCIRTSSGSWFIFEYSPLHTRSYSGLPNMLVCQILSGSFSKVSVRYLTLFRLLLRTYEQGYFRIIFTRIRCRLALPTAVCCLDGLFRPQRAHSYRRNQTIACALNLYKRLLLCHTRFATMKSFSVDIDGIRL